MKVIYPGSFDPITYGHLDVLERATNMFDKVLITIAVNTRKNSVFTPEERSELIHESISGEPWFHKVEIHQFSGLLVDFAQKNNIKTLIRGVRQFSDYEYEFRMALMNRKLNKDIDTLFLMPREELTFVSGSLVREIACWKGDLSPFVPVNVAKALMDKFS
ncbi:pantetheine-phosphate adenylyltransferase [Balneolaceae bacterium ANBcel3]|nr:pantetheine-phosphate adenylyltransferase [Balneolaceae bacterium ANBcel3]